MARSPKGNPYKQLIEKRSADCRKLASSIRKDSQKAGLKMRQRRYLELMADQLDLIGDGLTESMSTEDRDGVRAWSDRARVAVAPFAFGALLGNLAGGFTEGFGARAYEDLFGEDTIAIALELTIDLQSAAAADERPPAQPDDQLPTSDGGGWSAAPPRARENVSGADGFVQGFAFGKVVDELHNQLGLSYGAIAATSGEDILTSDGRIDASSLDPQRAEAALIRLQDAAGELRGDG